MKAIGPTNSTGHKTNVSKKSLLIYIYPRISIKKKEKGL